MRFLQALGCFLLLASAAGAQTKICYQGQDFTGVTVPSPYTTSDSISGCFNLSVTLPATTSNSVSYSSDITSFSISDGVQTLTQLNPDLTGISLDLEMSSGIVETWTFQGNTSTGDFIYSTSFLVPQGGQPPFRSSYDEGYSSGDLGNNFNSPGSWTIESVSSTPEPPSIILFASGLLALLFFIYRKHL
jgi:hypothetical protein